MFKYRDKRAAHKDDDFFDSNFTSLMDIVVECKSILVEVKKNCVHVLPAEITLDYVCYDRDLFRNLYHISKQKEEYIKMRKYPNYLRKS